MNCVFTSVIYSYAHHLLVEILIIVMYSYMHYVFDEMFVYSYAHQVLMKCFCMRFSGKFGGCD
jgi:hypothetical protein